MVEDGGPFIRTSQLGLGPRHLLDVTARTFFGDTSGVGDVLRGDLLRRRPEPGPERRGEVVAPRRRRRRLGGDRVCFGGPASPPFAEPPTDVAFHLVIY